MKMEKDLTPCCVQGCQGTSVDTPLYLSLIDSNAVNSWLVNMVQIENSHDSTRTVYEQCFLCLDHMNLLESMRRIEQSEKQADCANDDYQFEACQEEDEEKEASVPDRLSQQLSTLRVSQSRTEIANDSDDAVTCEVIEEEHKSFLELKSMYSQNLDSIFPPLADHSPYTCRLCGKDTICAIPIFSDEEDGDISVFEKIRCHIPINLEKDDNGSKVICQKCNQVLNVCQELIMTSLTTEAALSRPATEEISRSEKTEVLGAAEGEGQVTSTQAGVSKNDARSCSQDTVSDGVSLYCSQSSMITSDEDEDLSFTKFDGIEVMRTYGKKRPLIEDDSKDGFDVKKKREVPIFEMWYSCNMCVASSTDEKVIKFHKHRHRLDQPVLFWCNFCSREFPKESIFTQHVLSAHKEQSQDLTQAHKCTSCHRVFFLRSTALIHYLLECTVPPIGDYNSKKGIQEVYIRYVYVCEFCWKGFSYVSILNEHRNQEHLSKHPWNGQMCIDEKQKRERIMDILDINAAFACKFCAHIFISLDNYIYHLKEHSNGAYICTTCGETFSVYQDFKKHRENRHDYRIVFREISQENIASSIPME